MSLHIGTLATQCRSPRGQEAAAAVVDAVARERLPYEIAAQLGPSLDREAAVVRLRRLDVRLRVDAETLRRGGLAQAWATALVRALHEALARPDADGAMLRRFASEAEYHAAMIAAVLADSPGRHWQFPELAGDAARAPAITVLDLLLRSGKQLGDVLMALRDLGALDAALAVLDEVGLERVVRSVATAEAGDGALDAAQATRVAARLAVARVAPQSGAASGRRQAIRLWLQDDRAVPLRGLWNALRLLLRLMEQPGLLSPASGQALGDDFPAWCEAVRAAWALGRNAPAPADLAVLRAVTPTAARAWPGEVEEWIASRCAGVLLLAETIRRLGWVRLLREHGLPARAAEAMLAGILMRALAGASASPPWQPGEAVEPAVGLLAGMMAAPDPRGVGEVFAGTSPAALAPLLAGRVAPPAWPDALDMAAKALTAAFAARVRGFRKAGREAVARHFLHRAGRILIGTRELRAVLQPMPFAIVLHVSGIDAPTAELGWLGGRRVTFVLEGL